MHSNLNVSLVCLAIVGALLMGTGCAAEGTRKQAVLPEKAAAAVKAACPGAKIEKVELEKKGGIDIYEAELEQGAKEMTIEVTADGIILDVETELAAKDLPKDVADAAAKAAPGVKITKCEKAEIRAEVQGQGPAAKVVQLATPKIVYEIDVRKDGQVAEIAVDANGKLLGDVTWKKAGEDDDEED